MYLNSRVSKAMRTILNRYKINYDYFNDHGYGLYITDLEDWKTLDEIIEDLESSTGTCLYANDIEMNY